jgi:hypothetical protein
MVLVVAVGIFRTAPLVRWRRDLSNLRVQETLDLSGGLVLLVCLSYDNWIRRLVVLHHAPDRLIANSLNRLLPIVQQWESVLRSLVLTGRSSFDDPDL